MQWISWLNSRSRTHERFDDCEAKSEERREDITGIAYVSSVPRGMDETAAHLFVISDPSLSM